MTESTAGLPPGVNVTYELDGTKVGEMTMPYWDPDRELGPVDLADGTYQPTGFTENEDGSVTVAVERLS